jgi:hypothetical protein
MENRTYLYLTGGLGNQLFQYAAALYLSKDGRIYIEESLGRPRGPIRADIFDFNLPNEHSLQRVSKSNLFLRKSLSYCLRSFANSRPGQPIKFMTKIMSLLTSLVTSLSYKCFVKVVPNIGVGYDNKLQGKHGNTFLIGYFQTYNWVYSKQVFDLISKITIKQNNSFVEECKKKSMSSKSLVVHIRLGDYLYENSFGIPSIDYYQRAIDFQISNHLYTEIWVFSDEIDKAKNFLPKDLDLPVIFKDDEMSSSAQILEAMRHGAGYVLANSTFSWWAATLSYSKQCLVIAPTPWFKKGESPLELIPKHWKLIDAY